MAPNNHADLGYPAQAYDAHAIRVVSGANEGDPIGGLEDCLAGDVYRLRAGSMTRKLVIGQSGDTSGFHQIRNGSEIGAVGDVLRPLGILTLVASDGERLAIVTVLHEQSASVLAIPLSPLAPNLDYTLIDASADMANVRLADVICVSFAAGTRITVPGGKQRPIESLNIGDEILTRDNGPQILRWVGKATLRAAGSFAPVVISAGTLGNNGDLVVSPHHRIFVYQRGVRQLAGTAEVLVQSKHLVDGKRVWRREGGYVDYYSLVFDHHEIIFAEGIAAESLMVNDATVRMLPADVADDLRNRFPGLRQSQRYGTEATRAAVKSAIKDIFHRNDPV